MWATILPPRLKIILTKAHIAMVSMMANGYTGTGLCVIILFYYPATITHFHAIVMQHILY